MVWPVVCDVDVVTLRRLRGRSYEDGRGIEWDLRSHGLVVENWELNSECLVEKVLEDLQPGARGTCREILERSKMIK
jgi:hypothetical protein